MATDKALEQQRKGIHQDGPPVAGDVQVERRCLERAGRQAERQDRGEQNQTAMQMT